MKEQKQDKESGHSFYTFSITPTQMHIQHQYTHTHVQKSCSECKQGFLENPIASDLSPLKLFSH